VKRRPALLPTISEIRYLLARLLLAAPILRDFVLRWSFWRCRHQASARLAHYHARCESQL
jgi:hypothetical protein